MDSSQYTLVAMEPDEYLKKVKVHKDDFGPFTMTRRFRTMKYNGQPDVVDLMVMLSKGAAKLFQELKLKLDVVNNLSYYPREDYNKSQTNSFNRNLGELKKLDMVRKAKTINKAKPVGKDTYMINPRLARCIDYEEAVIMWEMLK